MNETSLTVPVQVKVYTSEKAGAGTSANVHITLFGSGTSTSTSSGSSSSSVLQYLRVDGARAAFNPGSIESFTLGPMSDIGDLTRVIIGHDGTGSSPAWHLHHVAVTNMRSGQMWTFPCYQWIGDPGSGRRLQGTEGYTAAALAAAAEKELRVGVLTANAGEEYDVAVYTGAEAAGSAGEPQGEQKRKSWWQNSLLGCCV